MPLGLLPVEPGAASSDGDLVFSGYRKVAWLARTHAVTMVPSASALRTLRRLPPGSPQREMMIGFGDPYFQRGAGRKRQRHRVVSGGVGRRRLARYTAAAAQCAADHGRRQRGTRAAARLPDTADELKSIALALQADPTKVLHLGKQANEKNVKSLDLTKYKVVVFATHGLVPGELNGLHQPALAMTATGDHQTDGDGLVAPSEKCGAQARRRLGGAVRLQHWRGGWCGGRSGFRPRPGILLRWHAGYSSHQLVSAFRVSARELVTDLFAREAADAKLSRGEALRQASMGLLDGPGFKDADGRTLFSYAHPLFWAPYTIIGDGGGRL